MQNKKEVRKKIRFLRKNLTQQEIYYHSWNITNHIINDKRIKKAKCIGLFFSSREEIRTNTLIKELLYLGKKIYLPIIHTFKKSKMLLFAQYKLSTCLILNRFKIYEPALKQKHLLSINELDILFVPLVAFDNKGNRLGMGGGFYDHTLQYWEQHPKKYIIGLAYDFQKIDDTLPVDPWDTPLPEIITSSSHFIWEDTKLITYSIYDTQQKKVNKNITYITSIHL